MRAIICAQGGPDPRWWTDGRPYLDTPKQLLRIDGETLLERTVRLLRARGVTDVVITAADERFAVDGAKLVTLDDPSPHPVGLNHILGTRPLWARQRTAILFGDVHYTDAAMDRIVGYDGTDITWVRRTGPSKITGHRWDEPFAITFLPRHHDHLADVARTLADGWTGPKKLHLWHLYAALNGLPMSLAELHDTPGQIVVDDWTDDIDTPADYAAFMGRYHAGRHRVAVCTPWTPGDRRRTESRDYTARIWAAAGVPVVYGTDRTGGRHVNRSAARNDAAARALADHPDLEVLFFADADTYVPRHQLWAAAHLAVERGQLVLAFHEYLRSTQGAVARAVRGGRRRRREADAHTTLMRGATRWTNHASGAVAVPVGLWHQVGGFDERFTSWGAEDRAFWLACNTLAGWCDRIHGPAVHLWHPASPERNPRLPAYIAGKELGHRYKRAAGWLQPTGVLGLVDDGIDRAPDVDAMRALLAEPGGPLAAHAEEVTV